MKKNTATPMTTLPQLENSIAYFARRRATFQDQADGATRSLRDCVEAAVKVHGVSEVRAAELAGVTRATVRSWLGK